MLHKILRFGVQKKVEELALAYIICKVHIYGCGWPEHGLSTKYFQTPRLGSLSKTTSRIFSVKGDSTSEMKGKLEENAKKPSSGWTKTV